MWSLQVKKGIFMNKESKVTNKLKELESSQPNRLIEEANPCHTNKLIRIKGVSGLTNLSKSYIYQLCKEDLFPQSVQLVAGGTSVAWVESEVLDWIESRIQARDEENANV